MENISEVWIVVEGGWEYNNGYYYRNYVFNGPEGYPQGAYLTKEAAEEAALKANIQQFKDLIKYKYREEEPPTDLTEIHKACLEKAQQYVVYDREDFVRAIKALNKHSPGLIQNPDEAEHSGWIPKLSRPLTDSEIALFMNESDIGNSYVIRVECHPR